MLQGGDERTCKGGRFWCTQAKTEPWRLSLLERREGLAHLCSYPLCQNIKLNIIYCAASPSLTDLRPKSLPHGRGRRHSSSYVGTSHLAYFEASLQDELFMERALAKARKTLNESVFPIACLRDSLVELLPKFRPKPPKPSFPVSNNCKFRLEPKTKRLNDGYAPNQRLYRHPFLPRTKTKLS